MRVSTHLRRGLRGAAVGAVMATGLVSLSTASASAAPAQVVRVPYACTATNFTIDLSLDGTQQFYVTAETDLPATVRPGQTVPATDTTLNLFLSTKLVNRLMGPMEVTEVKGGSTTNVDLKAVAPGGDVIKTIEQQVKGPNGEKGPLVKDWVTLVKDQEVKIVARGRVDAIPVPDAPDGDGLIYVQTPQSFMLHSEMSPPVIGQIDKADLKCVHGTVNAAGDQVTPGDPAQRVIGTIAVGDGCSRTDCPLPPDGTGSGPGPDTGSGDGSGTDPAVIEPGAPDDQTDISDSGYTWEDTDGDGVADTQVTASATSAQTTSLPATGSPFAAGIVGLLAALTALRMALAVRARRRAA